jgi:hypothetical protein
MNTHQPLERPRVHARTHSSRCCTLCRLRKTRCELPPAALSLPAGSGPLPSDQACHRCNVLSTQCILVPASDRTKRPSKRSRVPSICPAGQEADGAQSRPSDSTQIESTAASLVSSPNGGNIGPSGQYRELPPVDHALPILSTFQTGTEDDVSYSMCTARLTSGRAKSRIQWRKQHVVSR